MPVIDGAANDEFSEGNNGVDSREPADQVVAAVRPCIELLAISGAVDDGKWILADSFEQRLDLSGAEYRR